LQLSELPASADTKEKGVPQVEVMPGVIPAVVGSAEGIDAQLDRGVAVLRASGRLQHEDDELDRALVLAVVDAIWPMNTPN
jgi:glycerol-3-phosphate responsive antiterminator